MIKLLFLISIILQISSCQIALTPGSYDINVTDINEYFLQTGDLQWNQIIRLSFHSTNGVTPYIFMEVTKNDYLKETIFDNAESQLPTLYVSCNEHFMTNLNKS